MTKELKKILEPYQKLIEAEIIQSLPRFGSKTSLYEACEYVLTSGGKRFRPAIVMMVANALSAKHSVVEAALAVEFFHTASLIADDLPCMDNEEKRRNKETVHKKFGEASALLTSYALIAAGYESLARNTRHMQHHSHPLAEKIGLLALENATFNTGIYGATGGQFLDLFPPQKTHEILYETTQKKTVSLFEIALVLGWLFGGGNLSKLTLVKKAAYHYGMAFQIADDIDDYDEDSLEKRQMNVIHFLGHEKTRELFHGEISNYFICLKELEIDTEELRSLGNYLIEMVEAKK
ncbi:putative geranyltranstransferase [Chlamydiales bacterium STE3]|nr:putative geranyltranstransferase [Chlamydiales bacterium STE3]